MVPTLVLLPLVAAAVGQLVLITGIMVSVLTHVITALFLALGLGLHRGIQSPE